MNGSTLWVSTTGAFNENATMNVTTPATVGEFYQLYTPHLRAVDKYTTPFIYCIGFPGNILSFIIWIQRRMRHSSGYYLAALALVDLVFLCLQVVYELHAVWEVNTLNFQVLCESFTIVFLAAQYLSPLLVLGFTVERYISVCHPFKRELFCTTRRAKIVILCLLMGSLALCGIQGYFWTFDSIQGECNIRHEVSIGGTESFWSIWTWVTEIVIFLLVPLLVLMFNILVIREAKRLSNFEEKQLHSRTQKTQATTIMLLAVSFYLIITTLPVTIVYALYFTFPPGQNGADPRTDYAWQRHFDYYLVRNIIQEIGMTHYACNFYIYLLTGKVFRNQFKRLFVTVACAKIKSSLPSEYTSLRSSFGASTKSTIVRLSVNGNAVKKANETPL